ncbi:sugar porter family MFS transporter [Parapedobacter pyrenivorans]|uniref:sugar porter family MFS transporter n=1 Tax=Parapedobacter pyrenivorans TaxID=1305674 RepID=UPI0033419D14
MVQTGSDRENKWYVYLIVLVASIGGFMFGFDLVIIAGALPFLDVDFQLTPALKGFAVSSAILGSVTGPLIGMWFTERLGRKKTMMLAAFFFMISTAGSAFAFGIWDFAVWRFLGGIGIGLAMISSPIYIAELSPPHLRGVLVNVNQLSNVIGINLAVIVGYLFSFDGWGWRWMFGSQVVPVVILMIGLYLVPESPRWLAARGRLDEALDVLTKINGASRGKQELQEISDELGRSNESKVAFGELWKPGIRQAVMIGIVIMVFSQINGVNMILLYAPTIMTEVGISFGSNAILSAIPVYLLILVTTLLAFPLINRFSRRGLLLAGVAFMVLGHLVMAINLFMAWPPLFSLIPMLISAGAFTVGLAPLSWIIVSEIFPNRVRGKALAVVCFFLYAASFVTAQFFPMMTDWFTKQFDTAAGVYLFFALVCAAGFWFCWRFVPETKGLSLEKISQFWEIRRRR